MDIGKVNNILLRGINEMNEAELRDLRALVIAEAEVDDDMQLSPVEEYVVRVATAIEQECGRPFNEAIQAVIEAAGMAADDGKLPDLPLDEASEEDLAKWVVAAQDAKFGEGLVSALQA